MDQVQLENTKYPKIDSLYERWRKDIHTKEQLPEGIKFGDHIEGIYSNPIFKYLRDCSWLWSEKLDGTNIRIIVPSQENPDIRIKIKGRDDNSSIPQVLIDWILDWIHREDAIIRDSFVNGAILFCEGVGENIQKGHLFGMQHLKLLDIKVGNFWLEKTSIAEIATSLYLDFAPIRLEGTIQDAINFVQGNQRSAFDNGLLEDRTSLRIEGLVGQPYHRLFDAQGNRIQVKIKWEDFKPKGK